MDNPDYDLLEPVFGVLSIFAFAFVFVVFYYSFFRLASIIVLFFDHIAGWIYHLDFRVINGCAISVTFNNVMKDFFCELLRRIVANDLKRAGKLEINSNSGYIMLWNFFGQFFFNRVLRDVVNTCVIVSFLLVVMPVYLKLGFDWTVLSTAYSILAVVIPILLS